jgi:hypothetical protein
MLYLLAVSDVVLVAVTLSYPYYPAYKKQTEVLVYHVLIAGTTNINIFFLLLVTMTIVLVKQASEVSIM